MADVFISYSRKDTEFVRRLHEALAAQNRDIWVDWEDIPATADWWTEVETGIESADSFVFVISPDSVMSDICRKEVEHAVVHHKRMIPIMLRDISDPSYKPVTHAAINSHNWIFFRDELAFDQSFQALLKALDTDLNYVREHTRLLVRGREWEGRSYHPGFLLTRSEMKEARDWLDQSAEKDPHPTPLQMEYLKISQSALKRQRAFLITLISALVIASVLAIVSVFLFREANLQYGLAREQEVIALGNAATSAANAIIAFNNAETATLAQGEAIIQANYAETQVVIAQQQANANATAQSVARSEANANATAQRVAQDEAFNAATQAAIATVAQGLAEIEADNAATAAVAEAQARATSVVNEALAIDSAATATYALGNLQVQTRRSTALGLAAQAQLELNGPAQELSVLLGLESLAHYGYTWQAEQALGLAVQNSRLRGILSGHIEPVLTAVYSPDGTKILTGSIDSTARIWDAATGDLLLTLAGHTGWINAVAWSPDGFQVVTAADDMTAKIWEADTGRLTHTLEGHTNIVISVAWSPDGTRIATASHDTTAIIWNATTGQPVTPPIQANQDILYNVSWSPDSTRILTIGYDNSAILWSARNGSFNSRFRGHTDLLTSASWSPDGSQLVTSSLDKTAIIWDVVSTRAIRQLVGHAAPIHSVDWSADGTKIATASGDGTVKLWDASDSVPPVTISASVVYTVDLSPDGTRLVTTGSDNFAKIWQIKPAGEQVTIRLIEAASSNVQWSPDGLYVVGGVQQSTNVWDGATGSQRRTPFRSRGGDVLYVAWSPDGMKVLVAKYTQLIEVWSASGELLLSLPYGTTGRTGSITSVVWSPDGTQFAASGLNDDTTVWDAETGRVLVSLPASDAQSMGTNFVLWSPDGVYLLTGNSVALRTWVAETGEMDAEIQHYGAQSAAWSPNGVEFLIGNDDGSASIFDFATLEQVLLVSGHIGVVSSVDWSPNGARFITASSDGKAKIWDAQFGDDLLTLFDNGSAFINADWSPDGDKVVTADLNGDVKVWKVWETLDDLVAFAEECCLVRDLTPEERRQAGLSD